MQGKLHSGEPVEGYEIHCGITQGKSLQQYLLQFDNGQKDGAISHDGQILGSYLHGLFDRSEACVALLNWAGLSQAQGVDYPLRRSQDLDRLASTMEEHLNLDGWLSAVLLTAGASVVY